MKTVTVNCDICGKQQPNNIQHWTHSWGVIDLNFKNMSAIQQHYKYEDCCPSCARVVHDKVTEAFAKIEAEFKSPLAKALK